MTRAATSVLVFGAYMMVQGAILMLAPSVLLGLFGLPLNDAWPRVVGWALLALGFYYVQNARANFRPFFTWTVRVRTLQFMFFAVLVLTGLMPVAILLISGLELLSGVWTWLELRHEAG